MKKLILLVFFLLSSPLLATHGTFQIGNGTKSNGMGGVAAAYPQDTIVAAVNPAGMYWVADQFDVGLRLFFPNRGYSYTGAGGDNVKSGQRFFPVPHFGFAKQITCKQVLGFSFYGSGGMNTHFGRNNPLYGTGRLGIDYILAVLAPSWSYELFPCQTIGIAPLLGIQRVDMIGFKNHRGLSVAPNHVTDRGYDWSYGIGVRIGWLGRLIPRLYKCGALFGGASYSTQIMMSRFPKYKGLFPQHGRVNVPANYTLGLRLEATPCFNVAFDFQQLLFSGVPAYNNPDDQREKTGALLGEKEGSSFGWRTISVYKVGADYLLCSWWRVRVGGSFGSIPLTSPNIDANIIAPATTKYHATIGSTFQFSRCSQLDLAYGHAFRSTKKAPSSFILGEVELWMDQNFFEFNYSWKF